MKSSCYIFGILATIETVVSLGMYNIFSAEMFVSLLLHVMNVK